MAVVRGGRKGDRWEEKREMDWGSVSSVDGRCNGPI